SGTRSPMPAAPRMLEPTVSDDGRLLVYHGTGNNLLYSVNTTAAACSAAGWKSVAPVASMYGDPDMAAYPIARHPIRDTEGHPLPSNVNVSGAYPWIQGN